MFAVRCAELISIIKTFCITLKTSDNRPKRISIGASFDNSFVISFGIFVGNSKLTTVSYTNQITFGRTKPISISTTFSNTIQPSISETKLVAILISLRCTELSTVE